MILLLKYILNILWKSWRHIRVTPYFIPLKFVATQQPRSEPSPATTRSEAYCKNRVYKTSINNVDELRRRIAEEWEKMDKRIIDKAVGEWRKKLTSVCGCCGGQFEHKMWTLIISISDFCIRIFESNSMKIEILLFRSEKTGCLLDTMRIRLCASFCKCNYITQYKEYVNNTRLQTTNFLTLT